MNLIRTKRFEHLNELDIHASEVPFDLWDRMAHYTLNPENPESISLIGDMLDEFLPLFSSRYFNLCGDETFDLGKGKSAARASSGGVGRVYVDFVKKIMNIASRHGKTPMFWGDIVLHHPDLIPEIPSDAIFLNWAYDPDVTEESTATFARAGVTQYVCPGTSGWSRFANDINSASMNIRSMVAYGRKYHAAGVLNTDWGDCTHVNLLANSYHGMILGAALSWNSDSFTDDMQFDQCGFVYSMERPFSDNRAVSQRAWKPLFLSFREPFHLGIRQRVFLERSAKVQETPFKYFNRGFTRARELHESFVNFRKSAIDSRVLQDIDEFIWSAAAIQWLSAVLTFQKINEYGQTGGNPLA